MLMLRNDEDRRQFFALRSPPGAAESGRARYAAAMHFYMQGQLAGETLEIYRSLSRLDHDDPVRILAEMGRSSDIEAGVPHEG